MQTTLMAYQTRINEARTRVQLRDILKQMDNTLVAETLPFVECMTDEAFGEWRTGWEDTLAGNEPKDWWVEKYLDIIVPPPIARMELYLTEEM